MRSIVPKLYEKRWLIAGFVIAGWLIGTSIGRILPPKYRSETVILIEQQRVPEHYVESNVTVDLQQRLQSMSEQILSRTRLLTLVDNFKLYRGETSSRDDDTLVDRMRKDIKVQLISAEGRPGQVSAFKISYSAPSPQLARDVTREITSLFINENSHDREQLSQETTAFLESQLNDARGSLTEQEDKLRDFRTQHTGELPEQLQSNLQILGGLQLQLQAANDGLNQAQQHNLYLRSLLQQYQSSGMSASPAQGANAAPSTVHAQLAALRAELIDLEARYTDRYPDVVRVKQRIAEIEAHASGGAEAINGAAPIVSSDSSAPTIAMTDSAPVVQLKGELSANELELKNQKAKINSLEGQINSYQARLNATPVREQQAAAVTRDYDQSRAYYETLLSKKLQSEMATNLERRSKGEQFRMIDPPNLPERPYWPNRLLCSFAGLGIGLAFGLALTIVLDRVSPRIFQVDELADFVGTGYVLGLPTLSTEADVARSKRHRITEMAAAVSLILVVPVITYLSYLRP
jgi:polysaccharide chain length determinant protein (PEP-CTERM system associated)